MQNEWIIDVLSDLKAFARQNGLVQLAEQLDDAVLVAMTELASQEKGAHAYGRVNSVRIGPDIGAVGKRA